MYTYARTHTHIYFIIFKIFFPPAQPRVSRRPPGAPPERPSPLLPRASLRAGLCCASLLLLLLLPKFHPPPLFSFDHDSVTLLVERGWCSEIHKCGKT